jgi:Tfp pilus assembly pilus retraction ATPase PilT
MQLLDDHLLQLVQDGVITEEVAMRNAQEPRDLAQRLGGSSTGGAL